MGSREKWLYISYTSVPPQVTAVYGGHRGMRVVGQAGRRAITYLDFYDLQPAPFSNTAAPGMLFLSGSHKAARSMYRSLGKEEAAKRVASFDEMDSETARRCLASQPVFMGYKL